MKEKVNKKRILTCAKPQSFTNHKYVFAELSYTVCHLVAAVKQGNQSIFNENSCLLLLETKLIRMVKLENEVFKREKSPPFTINIVHLFISKYQI